MNVLTHSTRTQHRDLLGGVAVTLSLTVVTRQGNKTRIAALPLVTLTPILFILWALSTVAGKQLALAAHCLQNAYELAAAVVELAQALAMAAVPFWNAGVIIGKALAFGIGIKL